MISNKAIEISATECLGYLWWTGYWNSGNQVKVFPDGNKRQLYLIINYVMFEITCLLLHSVQIMYN